MTREQLKTAAREAWLYALPLIEIAATRARSQTMKQTANTFTHIRTLADHRHRLVTTPNNDTLYSSAHLDLSHGPLTLTLPATHARYLSVALMDAYSNNFAILGSRTTGPGGGTFTIVGPTEAAEGANVVRSPTRHVWALARLLVEGAHDMAAAHLVQGRISLQGPGAPAAAALADRRADWAAYFAAAATLMAADPPPATDRALLARIAPLGLEGGFDPARFSPGDIAAIEEGVAEARNAARAGGLAGDNYVDGWSYPAGDLGVYGQNYLQRAQVALGGLAALPPVEAMYMRARGDLPRALFDGAKSWRMHVPAGQQIPVESFWSLSLYDATEDGQFFFADNPVRRYAIGDRTPGLATNADGSLDIWIGRHDPGPGRQANWLPAPAGPFALFMRAYIPKPALLEGRYRLPAIKLAAP